LAMDTALGHCGVAVYRAGEIFSDTREMMHGHAEHLIPMTESVLKKAGIAYEDLDGIAVTSGPGAFTGLRIGLSAARALALALNIPIYGLTTTQLLALQNVKRNPSPVTIVIDTKRGDFYTQSFDGNGAPASEAAVKAADQIDLNGALAGDGVELLGGKAGISVPDVGLLAELLATRVELFSEGAEPVYLRGADVTASKKPMRTIESRSGV
jgi:tRNA threonylcarbamoyladenosine biosynthesis protein TsaB